MANKKINRAVGLEIDCCTVRAVEAFNASGSAGFAGMASAPIADGAVEDGIISAPQQVGSALKELWSRGPVRHRQVLLGISNQGVIVRQTAIPKVGKDKLANVIRFQAQELLPVPIESVVLDHLVLGEISDNGNTMVEVLLVAAKRDMLKGFLEALREAKLEPVDIDVSTLALMRTLPAKASEKTIAVVNIADGQSSILVAGRGVPRLARLIGSKLKDLASNSNSTLEQLFVGINDNAEAHLPSLEAWIESLANEISSSLSYYQNLPNSSKIESVVINGRGALLPGIHLYLEQALGIPVRVINPFSEYKGAEKKIQELGIGAVEYAICAGLALRGLEVG